MPFRRPDNLDLMVNDQDARVADHLNHGRLSRIIRVLLVIVVVSVGAAVFLWPELEQTQAVPTITPEAVTAASNELVNPSFESTDKDQQPYTIKALRAVQNAQDPDLLDLDHPQAALTLENGITLSLRADQGLYQQNNKSMELTGHVAFSQSEGYVLNGERAAIDFKTQRVVSDMPVAGQGPLGDLHAQAMQGDGVAGVVVFQGPATLILNQSLFE